MKIKNWAYRDPKAPSSPWGRIQTATTISRGVRFVETASHGGLMISPGAAKKFLSPTAQNLAEQYGNYLCFEEDCLCMVAFLENPAWLDTLLPNQKADPTELKKRVNYWYPQYFSPIT